MICARRNRTVAAPSIGLLPAQLPKNLLEGASRFPCSSYADAAFLQVTGVLPFDEVKLSAQVPKLPNHPG
jgi:hypothetical protein